MTFLARRFGFYLVTAWAAITMNFFIPRLMPGNPVELKSGDEIIIGKTFLKLVVESVS